NPYAEHIPTRNPAADQLEFTPAKEAEQLTDRLSDASSEPEQRISLDLNQALAYSIIHSREYRFLEEEYVLAALRLLVERHLWGPRFFNDTSAVVVGNGDDGFFDTSMRLINEFSVV